jgi:hypothetical protein
MKNTEGPYRAYDVLTNEQVGRYESLDLAYGLNIGRAITVIYRPSKRKVRK